ncbi:PREDICTED: protein angel isoform X1 [Dufourea novaeangliae]|uniref:protein angel isoform X1 n=2 Tax=Dufourea novaeangliae TaxID=178035 RepID=UPI000767D4D8|nr:PREDICTED: protein angel isoform X1 [Dufourea novaeangliae]
MNTASKLVRKIHTASLDTPFKLFRCEAKCVYYDIIPFPTPYMSGVAAKPVFLRNFCKSVSLSQILSTSCSNLMESMTNSAAQQTFNQASMESFFETYYNSSSNCDVSLNFASGNLACDSDSQCIGTNTCFETSVSLKDKYLSDRPKYKAMRYWKRLKKEKLASNSEDFFIVRLLSFNILAQCLLETYPFLYQGHDKRALPWKIRRQLLLQEILGARANVICLQEMQEEHVEEFLVPFLELGYNYLYKKRTNEKKDGLLFLYRSDQFILLDHAKVELYQSGIELLSRDNVGIIAKLAVKDSPEIQMVIATTHLLYNPKRNDVRLGQTQLLLAEIERIAFLENTLTGPKYLPIILAGDFNLKPYSGVYKFITEGAFEYQGKGRNLQQAEFRSLSNSLIPPRLCVTDNCQHFNILKKRLRGEGSATVMLESSEQMNLGEHSSDNNSSICSEVNADTSDLQVIEVVCGCQAKFSSGTLTHPFRFSSIYKHQNHQGKLEATTNQGAWITVDYIFYSDLEPLERYRLPTTEECSTLPTIPNFAVGSDHFCLGATFKSFLRTGYLNHPLLC